MARALLGHQDGFLAAVEQHGTQELLELLDLHAWSPDCETWQRSAAVRKLRVVLHRHGVAELRERHLPRSMAGGVSCERIHKDAYRSAPPPAK